MRIRFFGAAGTVTGSCTLIETERARILVDAGLFQGSNTLERKNAKIPALGLQHLDAVLLTHAHLDHCGRLPIFTTRGLTAPIYATRATCDLTRLILSDAAHIQEEDVKRQNRHNHRQGLAPVKPLFTFADVFNVVRLLQRVPYGLQFEVAEGIKAQYYDAGHILGSAIVDLWVREGKKTKRLVFSGDLGYTPQPVIGDPAQLKQAHVVVMESTYGDRDHRAPAESLFELENIIRQAQQSGGKILIPSFAVGRTQTLLYYLREFYERGLLVGVPVFLDSPMAIEATQLYERYRELYDSEAVAVSQKHRSPFDFAGLHTLHSAEDSRSINELDGPAIIIAGSGMCNGGRILHHLRHHLWRENTHVVFAGFQAQGTLGRRLVDGARRVNINGEPIVARAKIHTIGGFSAHADQTQLLRWLSGFSACSPLVILNHGEDHARKPLQAAIQQKGWKALLANEGEAWEL